MSVIHALREDVSGALRGLWKNRGFTVAALSTLALGIGATSAVFNVVKAVLLTPLPYASPKTVVMIWSQSASSARPRCRVKRSPTTASGRAR